MKKLQTKWLPIVFLITIGLILPACKDKNEPSSKVNQDLPESTTVRLKNMDNAGTAVNIDDFASFYMSGENNFVVSTSASGNAYVLIQDIGTTIWSEINNSEYVMMNFHGVSSVAAFNGHYYIIKHRYPWQAGNVTIYFLMYMKDDIKNANGVTIGAEIQYKVLSYEYIG